jgi:spermidine synthase
VLVGLPIAAALLAAAGELRVAWAGRSPRRLARAVVRPAHGQTSEASGLPVPPLWLMVAAALAALLIWLVPATPWKLVAFGRYVATHEEEVHLLYLGEGANSSIAVTENTENQRYFHVSGKIEASSAPHDMRLQRLLGHLPAFLHPRPRSVLVVGCGAGVTAGSFVYHPDVERIVICELEPLIPPMAGRYFAVENYAVVDDPRVQIVHDDARHYILTTREKFDIITSDPIHPWVKGSATLYSQEYFELCRQRLNPGGLVTQWVPLYESDVDVVKCEVATFLSVFPQGTMWSNDTDGVGYDTVMLGADGPMTIDVDRLQQRLHQAEYAAAALSLKEVGFQSAVGLLATYAGRGRDLADWLAGAAINRDRNLRLQYLAGLGLNAHQRERILDEILARRKYPDNLFTASPILKQSLRDTLK